jgi:hypothetical protein
MRPDVMIALHTLMFPMLPRSTYSEFIWVHRLNFSQRPGCLEDLPELKATGLLGTPYRTSANRERAMVRCEKWYMSARYYRFILHVVIKCIIICLAEAA